MDAPGLEQMKRDVREGRIDADRLVDLFVAQQRELAEARERIEQLERELKRLGKPGATEKVAEPYSMRAEEKRQGELEKKRRRRAKAKNSGRKPTLDKVAQAERIEKVFPQGVPEEDCFLSHTRVVWRLEQGRAVLVAYEVYRGPGSRYGKIPGAVGRSEFGLEIIVLIAHLVYVVGLSFDKVCLLLNVLQNLKLRKSQVDASLHQLSRQWEKEFETLCELLACSAVVHADETSWSLNSVWALLSEGARVLLFGVHKDGATLERILDPGTFEGIVVSDNAAVYSSFTKAQKCWAHLLRKAIKLTLLEPDNTDYREFTDQLFAIYRKACRVQRDGRLGDAGRQQKVDELNDEVLRLCGGVWAEQFPRLEGPDDMFRRLCNEVTELLLVDELFTFVTAKKTKAPNGETTPVSGTNNEAERTLRGPAMDRKTGRANKTSRGARRRTVIGSVLESLRRYLPEFTLPLIVKEVLAWQALGRSCFARQLAKLRGRSRRSGGDDADRPSVLDTLLPIPAD